MNEYRSSEDTQVVNLTAGKILLKDAKANFSQLCLIEQLCLIKEKKMHKKFFVTDK